jgi:predicted nuclease of predicted toxin-antitoxin system
LRKVLLDKCLGARMVVVYEDDGAVAKLARGKGAVNSDDASVEYLLPVLDGADRIFISEAEV